MTEHTGGNDAGQKDAAPAGLTEQVRALQADVELLDQLVRDYIDPAPEAPQAAPADDEPFEPRYSSLEPWVESYFAPMFSRPLNQTTRWCAQWWDHAEAISRLEALWRTWEVARLDELRGMATWYRDFLDAQLAVLLSATGPFAQCTADRHSPTKPLATLPAPEGYWDDEPEGEPLPDGSPYTEPATPAQEGA